MDANRPIDRLRHHVTGAIERGEAKAIECIPDVPALLAERDSLRAERDRLDKLTNELIVAEGVARQEADQLKAVNADLVAALELAKGTLVQCRDKFDRMGLDGDAYEWTATAHAFNTAAAALAKAEGGGK